MNSSNEQVKQSMIAYLTASHPRATIETATREIVDALLSLNTNNRKIKNSSVRYYREEIRLGRWVTTNQGIGVDSLGRLTDGQHRLEAMRAEGYPPVRFVLVVGLPKEAQQVTDIGSKRSRADLLRLTCNLTLHNTAVAAINVILKARNNWQHTQSTYSVAALAEEYERLESAFGLIDSKLIDLANAPIIAAIVESVSDDNVDHVRELIQKLVTGEGMAKGDPVLALREFVLRNRGKGGGGDVQRERYEKARRAIGAALAGEYLSKLVVRGGAK